MNLALRFAETAGRLPSKVAVFDDAGQHTFGALLAAATALAARVRTETARENVGILAPTSAAFPVAYFGTLLADKAAVPLNPRLDAKALSFFVRDAGLDTIVGCRPFADACPVSQSSSSLVLVLVLDSPGLPSRSGKHRRRRVEDEGRGRGRSKA